MADNVVKNNTKGYGYNYASLSDIAIQGFKIPKMKTGLDTFGAEYVYYYDEEIKDWLQGAKVVVPDNIVNKEGKNKMNAAQLYGSALTYARRFTTYMALGLATSDDCDIENLQEETPKEEPPKKEPKKSEIFDEPMFVDEKTMKEMSKLFSNEELSNILKTHGILSFKQMPMSEAKELIANKQGKGKEFY